MRYLPGDRFNERAAATVTVRADRVRPGDHRGSILPMELIPDPLRTRTGIGP
jgi:hypothetical protein